MKAPRDDTPVTFQTTQIGSHGRYVLDIDDIMTFPDIGHIPVLPHKPGESWFILTEIVSNISIGRPTFRVEDKLEGNYWVVAFYTDNPVEDARDCVPGSLICIKNRRPHRFLDGRYGFRIDDPSRVLVLPCTMARLKELNNSLRERSNAGLLLTCVVCNTPVRRGCERCETRYCSQECQRQDWPNHKRVCKVLKTLHE
ncbi:hypothetical protein M422DRAFT_276283 [Sphaerobolus stellatus SS14]|uniref:MYND-type domain-containing protein n=1 Tax=Sphaerobolus stellatus (strain SS14) TaxID=990650 RepID=A0A0C9TMV2_SPHS4|nr:hypothetical protein M422DRAFT_276283 [Sphaerobolus stellatus SS14]